MHTVKKPASVRGWQFLIIILLVLAMPFNLAAQSLTQWNHPAGVIVIDPGHGGNDEGARGTGGTLEKHICLQLARKLADFLEDSYKVVLTRNGDYSLPNVQRTATANHHKADAFISLHTAAAFQHTAEGINIYQYHPAGPPNSTDAPQNPRPDDRPVKWHEIQIQHAAASTALAAALKNTLQALTDPKLVRLQQAPLQVLAGADMPALVIEIGYLTHPLTEKNLISDTQLTAFARAIANGIDAFMAAGSSTLDQDRTGPYTH